MLRVVGRVFKAIDTDGSGFIEPGVSCLLR